MRRHVVHRGSVHVCVCVFLLRCTMAHDFKGKTPFNGKTIKGDYSRGPQSAGFTKKRKWVPANKFFSGSIQEGQGFAFNRKQKTQRQYNKLLRKEKWRMKDFKPQLNDSYPEHLKHLYMAEQEKLDEEEKANENRRRKVRPVETDEDEEEDTVVASVRSSLVTDTADSVPSNEQPQSSQNKSSHKDLQRFTKKKKMSSYQKSKQEYEKLKEERDRKREQYLKDKAQREEALKKYKKKKQETYQLLKKKTKKGQPNLNLQMELLLQKIQSQHK